MSSSGEGLGCPRIGINQCCVIADPMEMLSKPGKKASDREEDMVPGSSPPEHEFISDSFADSHIDEAALRKEMQQLGMDDKPQPPTAEGKQSNKKTMLTHFSATICLPLHI